MNRIKVRKQALPEIKEQLDSYTIDEKTPESKVIIYNLFQHVCLLHEEDDDSLDSNDDAFLLFANKHLIDEDEQHTHLPVPVFSYLKPTMGVHFILHILLSMGKFDTEIDMLLQPSLRMSFRYASLIEDSDDLDDLQSYSDTLLQKFIKEQIKFYPTARRVIDEWIIAAGEPFDSVIVKNSIPISQIPPVQFTSIFSSMDDAVVQFKRKPKSKIIDAAFKELGGATQRCSVPDKEILLSTTKSTPLIPRQK